MIWWTGLAPWEFEFPFPGSLTQFQHKCLHQLHLLLETRFDLPFLGVVFLGVVFLRVVFILDVSRSSRIREGRPRDRFVCVTEGLVTCFLSLTSMSSRQPALGRSRDAERLVFYCRTTSASTAPCTPRRYAALRIVLVTVPRVSRSCEHPRTHLSRSDLLAPRMKV